MLRRSRLAAFALLSLTAASCFHLQAAAGEEEAQAAAGDAKFVVEKAAALATFRESIQPLFVKHCSKCHGAATKGADGKEEKPKGELSLDGYLSRADVAEDRQTWEKISEKLHAGEMPPEDEPQLDPAQKQQIIGWIDTALARNPCGRERDPGRVTIRRLNRAEYNNTIRDLVGIDFHPADDFPSDDVGYGFDHIGDVLSMPPILLEKYLNAAQKVVEKALGTDQANLATGDVDGGTPYDGGSRVLASDGDVRTKVRLFGKGDYIFRVRAYGEQAGDEPAKMGLYLDKTLIRTVDVKAVEGKSQVYEAWMYSKGGEHHFSAAFMNDYYRPDLPGPGDRNLVIEKLEVMGPYPPPYKQIVGREHTPEDKLALAREVVGGFMTRAFRRPSTNAEVDRVMKLVEMADRDGNNFAMAVGLGLEAILVSPHFLFRVELDPDPNRDAPNGQKVRTLNDFELATRLSYFLWSSMPDDELMAEARLGRLHEDEHLDRQVRRMLADPKAQALVENFAGQWLQLRNLKTAAPDKQEYPGFDEALRTAMQTETELFFAAVMQEDRSVLDFLDADYTFVNERLAQHYGIADVKGKEFRKVQLDPAQRGGVLTQASVLTVTSNPTRTSPVKRGKWVLENILGTPPPPPPADVPPFKEEPAAMASGSVRVRMEQHRANPDCAICHNRMDPLGFGLENYDGIGSWRTEDGKFKIDASGKLPNGQAFAGPRELKGVLRARQGEFVRCLAEKMLTYGLGRGVEYSDKCTVADISKVMEQNDYQFSSLILGVVHSDAFRKRSGPRSEP